VIRLQHTGLCGLSLALGVTLVVTLAAGAWTEAGGALPLEAEQAQAVPADPVVRGTLLVDDVPADSGTVVLHRVTPAESGPVDSVQVDADGGFALALPHAPETGSGEVFFASARREGILYFGPPVTQMADLDEPYVISSYGTRPAPPGGLPFAVRVRNVFIDEGPMGWRATDLIEIHNDSAVTWVSPDDEHPVWRYPLPPGARSFRVGESGLSEDAVRFEDGGILVFSPVPPGERLYMVQYELEDLEFSLPLPGFTEVVEVLMREPSPAVTMEGLRREQPVQLEPDVFYARWRAQDVSDRVVRVRRGEDEGGAVLPWVGLGLALLLLGAGIWGVRRQARPPEDEPPSSRQALLLEVAELDEAFEALDDPDPETVARYQRRRKALMERVRAADPPEAASPGARDR
jgi:hypothetical protein